ELGHGQQELSIRHAPALAAADRQVLYRETVWNVAYRHGLYASLAPKPLANQAGNGAHIHSSLWDPAGQRNLTPDPSDRHGLPQPAPTWPSAGCSPPAWTGCAARSRSASRP